MCLHAMTTCRAWGSEGTRLDVCLVDAQTFEEHYTCEQVLLPMVLCN